VSSLGLAGSQEKAGSCPNKMLALYFLVTFTAGVMETVLDETDLRSGVLHKLIVDQLVNMFLAFYGNQSFSTVFARVRQLLMPRTK
jgi:hypothetical protein